MRTHSHNKRQPHSACAVADGPLSARRSLRLPQTQMGEAALQEGRGTLLPQRVRRERRLVREGARPGRRERGVCSRVGAGEEARGLRGGPQEEEGGAEEDGDGGQGEDAAPRLESGARQKGSRALREGACGVPQAAQGVRGEVAGVVRHRWRQGLAARGQG